MNKLKIILWEKIDLTFYVVLLFALCYLMDSWLKINLILAPGLLLLLFLPGYCLGRFLRNDYLGSLGRIALYIFMSFVIFSILDIFLVDRLGLTQLNQIILVLGINFLFAIICTVFNKITVLKSAFSDIRVTVNKYSILDYIILVIPLVVLIVTLVINPFAQDADGYLSALKNSLLAGTNVLTTRQIFVSILALVHFMTGFDYVFVFRMFFPFLFYFSTWFLFDYFRQTGVRNVFYLAYLLILSAPVVLSEVNIIRPQVALVCLTIPILMLSIYSLKLKRWDIGLISLILAGISLKYHELSILLLLLAFMVIMINLYWLVCRKKITYRHLIYAIIVVLPYFKIFPIREVFAQAISMAEYAIRLFPGFHWRWWFITDYKTIDGFNLGWVGIGVLYYYLYNGILLILLVLVMLFFAKKKKRTKVLLILPGLLYFFIFIFIAELLPRMGLFFLPNRAWVHLVLASFVLLVVWLVNTEKPSRKLENFISLVMLVNIIIGAIGIFYVAENNVNEVCRAETKSLNFITLTPQNTLFLSSQDENTLINFYGKRNFIKLDITQKINKLTFEKIVGQELDNLSVHRKVIISPEIREEVIRYVDDKEVSRTNRIIQKLSASEGQSLYGKKDPVYFIFSYAKITGLNAQRQYVLNLNDEKNNKVYRVLGYPISYDDGNILIIKLR